MLEAFESSALRHFPVAISGEWLRARTRDWRGEVRAEEPIVAVSFCIRGRDVSWCKSDPADHSHPIRLLLAHYDSGGRDVQVNFSVGETDGSVRTRTLLPSAAYRPAIRPSHSAGTSTLVPYATVEGSHPVQVLVLFLASSDVKLGRNRLWHLRTNLLDSVPAVFRTVLARGRAGELAAA